MEIFVVGFGEVFAPGAGFCERWGLVGNAIGSRKRGPAKRDEGLLLRFSFGYLLWLRHSSLRGQSPLNFIAFLRSVWTVPLPKSKKQQQNLRSAYSTDYRPQGPKPLRSG